MTMTKLQYKSYFTIANSQKTPHSSTSWVKYGVPFVNSRIQSLIYTKLKNSKSDLYSNLVTIMHCHISPYQVGYGMSIVNILNKIDIILGDGLHKRVEFFSDMSRSSIQLFWSILI